MNSASQTIATRVFTACLALLASFPATVLAADVELTIRADEPGETISRYVYGQFAEHLGRGIYGGIWVGEDSEIPNTNGFRDDVIAALKKLEIPVIRWPGGCFADEYHWRDGVGPRDERPVRINTHWGWVIEDNAFGTHEFMQLVELLDSEAYIAGNIGSGTPREMAEWLAYLTEDKDTTLARLRRENGREEPWKVAFWGVGNETWGCGGNMTPEYYTDLYKRYATFLKAPPGRRPELVASGGSNDDTAWTRALASGTRGAGFFYRIDGISHHYYTLPTGEWEVKGASRGFPEAQWISTLHRTLLIDGYLGLQEAVLDEHDPDGEVGIYLDEWGTWYDPEEGDNPGFLYQQNTIRDALVAALNFHVFHRHARRLHMANIAQTVNVLQAVILTDEERMVLTPTYHAFRMHIPFQDAAHVPVKADRMPQYASGEFSVPHVSATAALTDEGHLAISLVNLHVDGAADVRVRLAGFEASGVSGQLLAADAMDAHNTFERPDRVQPRGIAAVLDEEGLQVGLPPRSVAVLTLEAASAR